MTTHSTGGKQITQCPKCGNADPEKMVPHIEPSEFIRKTTQSNPMRVASWTCHCGEQFNDAGRAALGASS